MSIKYKMLIPSVALAVVSVIAVLIMGIVTFSNYVDGSIEQQVETSADMVSAQVEGLKQEAMLGSKLVAADATVRSSISSNNRNELVSRAVQLMAETKVDFLTIMDEKGNVLVRAHDPENYGDSLASQTNVQVAMGGMNYTTIETGSSVKLSIRSGTPIYDNSGKIMGVVSGGFRLDRNEFADSLKSLVNTEVTIFLGDERLITTVINADGQRAVGTKADAEVTQQVMNGHEYSGHGKVVGRDAFVSYLPLRDTEGTIVGMLFAGEYTDVKNEVVGGFTLTSILTALVLLALGSAVVYYLANKVIAPVRSMVTAAEALAEGNVDVNVEVSSKDEMRQLADSFNMMIENNKAQAHAIERISKGDLTIAVDVRSDRDVVGMALNTMLDQNNIIFSQVTAAATQVSMGAGQVADGASQLAQNTTEQAASVEQLSTAISEIAQNTRLNAERADEASSLSQTIRGQAETGSDQMRQMIDAVQDISKASADIQSVINIIDNIAFQTNILALNAAVEAARAGSHGKGFAVVADEVRNLASKSADAASETATLIENSIEKARQGVDIATETSKSLDQIVEGVNKSSVLVEEISSSSGEQASAIETINHNVEQVTLAVHSTSALSEETAASSEEMSSQSTLLTRLVSNFKLRDQAEDERDYSRNEVSGMALRADPAEDKYA